MDISSLILNLETSFIKIMGIPIQGLIGLLLGSFIFSGFILLLRYKNTHFSLDNLHKDNLSDVGDPIEASLNLSFSLIEMREYEKASEFLNKILDETENATQEQKNKAENLLKKMDRKQSA